jgi:DNA-binding CsgD family transcriptional regulator
VLELGSGRYEAALRIARRQAARDGIGAGTLALVDLVEAAVRCDERDIGLAALEQLTPRAEAAGTTWATGLLARARALLADDDDADMYFRASIEQLAGCQITTDRARSQLLYGEWLRRTRRRRDARDPLHEALEFFDGMGASLFAARARQELAATGERVQRGEAPVDLLTPQEAHIARRAAAGDRNHEIASQLFVTTSTVEYHLRKVFVKLGVRSRTELATLDLPA